MTDDERISRLKRSAQTMQEDIDAIAGRYRIDVEVQRIDVSTVQRAAEVPIITVSVFKPV